jgi:hypothetical protein
MASDHPGYPGVQAWWRLRSHHFNEEFAKHINQLQQTAKPPRLYREPNPDQRSNRALQPTTVHFMHVYEVRPRKDRRGVDLISDAIRSALLLLAECNQ